MCPNSLNKFYLNKRGNIGSLSAAGRKLYDSETSTLYTNNADTPNDESDNQPQILPEIKVQLPCGEMLCNKPDNLDRREKAGLGTTLEKKLRQTELEKNQQDELFHILNDYQSVFSDKPELTDIYQHKIILKDEEPFIKKSYPVAFAMREAVEKTIKEMLDIGVIKREPSPYCSPMTVVRKKDNSVRICLDARTLNTKMVGDCESPPSIQEILQRFHHVKYLTSIDLTSSYWPVPLYPANRKYMAILYNGRTYTY